MQQRFVPRFRPLNGTEIALIKLSETLHQLVRCGLIETFRGPAEVPTAPLVTIFPPVKTRVILRRNVFDRWVVFNAENPSLAWSGSSWVPVNRHGLSTGGTQISNLESLQEALQYIAQFGFELRQVGGGA